jgi:hypothetical protein
LAKKLYLDPMVNPNPPWDGADLEVFFFRMSDAYSEALKEISRLKEEKIEPTWKTSLHVEGYPYFSREAYLQKTPALPSSREERVYEAAEMLAYAWPWDQLPLANATEAQTAIQGILAITYLFGDFGKLGQVETNNWFQAGGPAVNNEPCGDMRTLNPFLQRCAWVYPKALEGAEAALHAVLVSPNVKEQLLSGDLGKLAHAVLKDGFFAPTPPTKEIWVDATRLLGEALADIVAVSGDTPRWKTSDFAPTDFVGMVNPNPCKEDEDLVAGACVKKQTPTSEEGSKNKSSLGWWLLGAGLALGAGGWWWVSSNKDETSPEFQG